MLTIGITGANGYVGSRIVAELVAAELNVIRLVRNPKSGTNDRKFLLGQQVSSDLFDGLDILIHCAWDMRVSNWDEVHTVNVQGSINLFSVARQSGVKKIIFISSMSAFQGCESNYGKAKLAVEAEVQSTSADIVIRPGLIYGQEPGGVVGAFLKLARFSPILPMVGAGNFRLHTCHEKDLTALVSYCCRQDIPVHLLPAAEITGRNFKNIVRVLAAKKILFIPLPWKLIWGSLKLMEALSVRSRLKSDSLIGLVKSNPSPDFSELQKLPLSFRPLSDS